MRIVTLVYYAGRATGHGHALLKTSSVGHTKMEGGDGLLARATYLDSLTVAQCI
jgi:hypothetical protein